MILRGSFCAVRGGQRGKLWWEFFSDPSQLWDRRSEKVSEHESYQSSHGAIGALVDANLVALLVAIVPWSKLWQKLFSDPLYWWDGSAMVVVGWKKKLYVTNFSC
jgi:hypothetical protein